MSQINVDTITNRLGTAGPTVPSLTVTNGVQVGGALTVTGNQTTSGNLTVTNNATVGGALTVTGNQTVTGNLAVTTNATVGGALTVTGNFTVNGTTTTIDTINLVVEDKNIGIGSTSSASNTTADGGGLTIFGGSDGDKTFTWEKDTSCFEYSEPNKFKGVIETVSTGSTYDLGGGNVVLELDVRNATTYTHSLSNGSVGIVSFKNMPADTGVSNGTTITVIFTQNATGTGNTTDVTGIGTNCFVVGFEDGATVAGISTRALVGSATTVTLSTTASDRDFVSFFVHYTGGTNTTASSYQVYATKNGGFRQGTVGV